MEREENTIYVASISHGKDSNAMLHVIKDILHWPLDYIITVDVWFDDDTRAELPPMVEWKNKADKIIYDRWGIPVEHLCAMRGGYEQHTLKHSTQYAQEEITSENDTGFQSNEERGATQNSRLTYKDIFYRAYHNGPRVERIYGFPMVKGNWCTGQLKKINFYKRAKARWCNI